MAAVAVLGLAVTVLPGRRWPELVNEDEAVLENSFVLPGAALAEVLATLRAPTAPPKRRAPGAGDRRDRPPASQDSPLFDSPGAIPCSR
jgi:hypothetical protein